MNKRFHVHLHVQGLDPCIGICSKLFAAESTRGKPVAIAVIAAKSGCC